LFSIEFLGVRKNFSSSNRPYHQEPIARFSLPPIVRLAQNSHHQEYILKGFLGKKFLEVPKIDFAESKVYWM
jgi:hypothetical protein